MLVDRAVVEDVRAFAAHDQGAVLHPDRVGAAVANELQTQAQELWESGGLGGKIGQVMPACLLLLEASGV